MRRHPRPSYNPSGFGNFATLRVISVQQTQPDTKRRRPDSLDQHVYGIGIEKRLERHVGENGEYKVDARLPGRVRAGV